MINKKMIIVVIGICAILFWFCFRSGVKDGWCNTAPCALSFFMGILLLVSVIAGIVLWVDCSKLTVIDARIEMYQEENKNIEEQISLAIKNYQDHEADVFGDLKPESIITLVTNYPELKSDRLIQGQLEVYVENNKEIKSLREEKINGSVIRWWGYFGK